MLDLKKHFTSLKTTPSFNILVMLILLAYPALLLTVRNGMGVLLGILLIISIVQLFRIRRTHSIPYWDNYSIAFALAMASPVLAIFLSQAYHEQFNSEYYDWASRFLFSIPVFLALRQTDIRAITVLQYGLPLGAIVGLILLKPHLLSLELVFNPWPEFSNHIHFGDTVLIIGFLSLFSINWGKKDHPLLLALKLCGFAVGIYMSIKTEARGGWAAMPILFLIWMASHNRKRMWLKFGIAIPIVVGIALLSYFQLGIVHDRIDSVFSDINNFVHGNKDTSIGIRFQLYLAATHLFFENPIFGVGPGGFSHAMSALTASGMVTTEAGYMGTAEVHNEILHKCAETGLFGLLSILSVYLVPTFIFWRSTKSAEPSIRVASFMGICLVAGFFIFGLTVEIFDLKMTATFFAFTLAILMAAALQHNAPETIAAPASIESDRDKSRTNPSATSPGTAKQSRAGHYVKIILAPLVAVLSLTFAIVAFNKYEVSQERLEKLSMQNANLSASLSATQVALKNLQSEIILDNALHGSEQKQREAQIAIIIKNINSLQIKKKISPTLEAQLRQASSAVTLGTSK